MKRRVFFGLSFLLFLLDCRSTNLLRLFSGNLPAMFKNIYQVDKNKKEQSLKIGLKDY